MEKLSPSSEPQQLITDILLKEGFSHFGWAPLQRPLTMELYNSWIDEGFHGDMLYLKTHAPIKENPQKTWPTARSAIMVGIDYLPHPRSAQVPRLQSLNIAAYAQGEDYHLWMKQKLEVLVEKMRPMFPDQEFFAFTDSAPILERDLGHTAGLGWVGKNTCLIHQKRGSFFFIGEILTSLDLGTSTDSHPDRCGTCSLCIDVCPTQALTAPRKLDATRCISYLTIESKSVPPQHLREKIGDHFFGCDLCQTVCPWNKKVFSHLLHKKTGGDIVADIQWILTSSGKELERQLGHTPLGRARSFGLKRNAMVVAANKKLREALPWIEPYENDSRLGELATWAKKILWLQES